MFLYLAVILTFYITQLFAECEDDWELYEGSCYYFNTEGDRITWEDAIVSIFTTDFVIILIQRAIV